MGRISWITFNSIYWIDNKKQLDAFMDTFEAYKKELKKQKKLNDFKEIK